MVDPHYDEQATEPSLGGRDLGPSLTSEDLQRLEIAARKSYVKVLLGVFAATLWVLFFGGYKIIAILIVLPLLFNVFLRMPSFEPVKSISIESSNGSGIAWSLRHVAGWTPFVFLAYLLISH